eukprot:GHVT01065094.1.p2 GENE.GHVT01065094.1~~GHVT01065094.1.p2  ORF type:complete len:112 (-),score=19.17 GHVT01065094.1:617-952(-)
MVNKLRLLNQTLAVLLLPKLFIPPFPPVFPILFHVIFSFFSTLFSHSFPRYFLSSPPLRRPTARIFGNANFATSPFFSSFSFSSSSSSIFVRVVPVPLLGERISLKFPVWK